HLTDEDLALLSRATGATGERHPDGATKEAAVSLRRRPERLDALLGRPEVFEATFNPEAEPLLGPSPFLVFAVAVHRAAAELSGATFVEEWLGPRQRVAVFDVERLRDFLADPLHRLFLVELLASFTHVASGSVLVRTRRGFRRQRFSELDPVRLASILEVVPETDRPGIYRRLGDLCLFLTGVFPDHTAGRALSAVGTARLLRAAQLTEQPTATPDGVPSAVADPGLVSLLEQLGQRWYHLAGQSVPVVSGTMRAVRDMATQFREARRALNLVTDRFLFPERERWFPAPGG
ncbi:MAG: hypothetical protein J2P59_07655, partial [Acidimicrobiales bacterium]|nr:hypothetical protein [Acidimicrobiales bacterium]